MRRRILTKIKNRSTELLLTLSGFLLLTHVDGATITAVGNGSWGTNSVWSCNCQPTNADNVIIPSGISVTISGPVILFLGPVITITINGTLILNNASLQVDGNDVIKINSGGKITATGLLGGTVSSGVIPMVVPNGSSITGPHLITGGILPITLLFFKGYVVRDAVMLEWASASEKNLDYYLIERCTDGKNFKSVGKIPGAGNSINQNNYKFVDRHPVSGVAYYQLKAVDIDGSEEVFNTIDITFSDDKQEVSIFPNPVVGNKFYLSLNFVPEGDAQMVIYDDKGFELSSQKLDKPDNGYTYELFAPLKPNVYIVVIKTRQGYFRSTILKGLEY